MPNLLRRFARRPRSIAKRLALLHIIAVFVSYTVFGLLFYEKRKSQKELIESRELAAEIVSVKAMLRQANARQLLEYEMHGQLIEAESSRMYIRILDRDGRTLCESQGMERIIPAGAFPPLAESETFSWQNSRGDHFTMKSSPLPGEVLFGPGCVLQIATNSNDRAMFEAQLRWTLVLFVVGGMVFAFVCAYLIVRFGLRPLDEISRTASSITRRDLGVRIDEAALPAELVSLAHSFNTMLARLEESFDRLSHYSGNLAHELRTPISTLTIAADIALSRERSPEEYRAVVASSLEELGRMSTIIDKMLFLARADIEQPDLTLQPLDFGSEVDNLFDYYSEAAAEADVALEKSGCAIIHADQTLFRRALSNLISNSLAHTPRGGAISVTCRHSGDLGVDVVVRDNGSGIEKHHLPKIFDRFYRVAGADGKASQGHGLGLGLGLAIVKAIMQMHGGCVLIDSPPGAGTEVILRFPPNTSSPG